MSFYSIFEIDSLNTNFNSMPTVQKTHLTVLTVVLTLWLMMQSKAGLFLIECSAKWHYKLKRGQIFLWLKKKKNLQ